MELPKLRKSEMAALRLRALYEEKGYRLFRMGSFEEYDLYMQNRPFLKQDDIITFTGADGRLMALKPDVTLSIVKNIQPGDVRRVYYSENVFRRSRHYGEYREINQMGLEFIGAEGIAAEAEVLQLAAESLAVVGQGALDLSHMEFIEAVLAPLCDAEQRAAALAALQDKSPHGMREVARQAGLPAEEADRLAKLAEIAGPFAEVLPAARAIAEGMPAAQKSLDELEALCNALVGCGARAMVRIDFSIINDADYYNGLIFLGFVSGIPRPVLSGGRYDNLLRRFGKEQGALGFAIYLDALGAAEKADAEADAPCGCWLNVALPKGRLGAKVHALMETIGLSSVEIGEESRKLIFEDEEKKVRYFLVKPTDVDIYVEHGAADIGVVGKDVLLESGADVLELLDLGFGRCRLAVAAKVGFCEDPAKPLRVATKYPTVARRHYAAQSRSVEIIKLHGSIELAPLLGLSDVIVDIVETGSTLRENNLEVIADVAPSSARLIVNRAAWRFKQQTIKSLAEKMEGAL